jgi:hypothetical protein
MKKQKKVVIEFQQFPSDQRGTRLNDNLPMHRSCEPSRALQATSRVMRLFAVWFVSAVPRPRRRMRASTVTITGIGRFTAR